MAHDGKQSLKMSGRGANWHGAAIDGAKLFINGNEYQISMWVRQDTGAPQTIQFAFQYSDDAGTQVWEGHVGAEAPSGEWVELKGSYTVPAGTTDGLILYVESTEDGDFYIDDVVIDGAGKEILPPKDISEFYDEMITASLVSTGNTERLKAAIQKAKDGKDVTLAYFGGSITEGYNATPNAQCWASLSAEGFKKLFGGNVNVVNGGMAGTSSDIGIVRYTSDILTVAPAKPDVVFIEFAVNDGDDQTGGEAYESLIREILSADNAPAVVLIFSVFQSQFNMQTKYIPLGEAYELPMVSIKDAVTPKISSGVMTNDQFFASDGLHPTNDGHQIMTDCVVNLFEAVDKAAASPAYKIPATPVIGDSFVGLVEIDSKIGLSGGTITVGGFTGQDSSTGTFQFNNQPKLPNNWKHETTSDNSPLSFETTFKNLSVLYKMSSAATAGQAEVLVDGKVVATLNSSASGAWNQAVTKVVFKEDTAKKHKVEIRMAAGDEAKEFTVLAMGYVK